VLFKIAFTALGKENLWNKVTIRILYLERPEKAIYRI